MTITGNAEHSALLHYFRTIYAQHRICAERCNRNSAMLE